MKDFAILYGLVRNLDIKNINHVYTDKKATALHLVLGLEPASEADKEFQLKMIEYLAAHQADLDC